MPLHYILTSTLALYLDDAPESPFTLYLKSARSFLNETD